MLFIAGLIAGIALGLIAAIYVTRANYHRLVAAERHAQQNERLAELGTLTGGLAHEIKNPLSTMQLNLQLLLEDVHPDDPLHGRFAGRIGTIQREASRLREILDDFLRFAGRIELQLSEVELNGLLQDLVDFLTPQAQLQRVQIRLRHSEGAIKVRLDPRLIKQAVLNLMLNGMQAMGESGGELILGASAHDGRANIQVIDTGKGMSPEVQRRIFQAYFSLRKGGTGLGLAMARRIIAEHGGEISVQSDEGKGSIFTISLPIQGGQRPGN